MKFIANISMCDPTFYVPLAQAAEAAGFDTIAVPDSIAYPKESSSTYPYNFDGTREFLENKPFIEPTVAIAAMAAVTSTIEFHTFVLKMPIRHPVIYAKEATSLAVISGNRFVLGVGHEPVARRLRDRAAAVGGPRSALRRVHRDRARPRRRWVLRVPRRVLRLPRDQDGAGADAADPGAHRRSQRRAAATGRAPRRRLDGRGRHARRPDPDDRPHERPAQGARPRPASGSTSTPPRRSRSPSTASSSSRTSASPTPPAGSAASTPTGSRPTPSRCRRRSTTSRRHGDEVISKVR